MFEVIGDIANIQVIAMGRGIRRLKNLRKRYGGRRWRKLKGCYRSTCERIGSKGGNPLVRGTQRRQEGIEDQAVSGLTIMRAQQSTGSFALCVEDGGLEDLEARKLYRVLPDREAAREGYLRVVDESGEDYIYPSELFVSVRLPAAVVRRLSGSGRARLGAKRLRPVRRAR